MSSNNNSSSAQEARRRAAQEASRAAYLKRETQLHQRAAAAALEQKLEEVASGSGVPTSLTEAELLLARADEVASASSLVRVAKQREQQQQSQNIYEDGDGGGRFRRSDVGPAAEEVPPPQNYTHHRQRESGPPAVAGELGTKRPRSSDSEANGDYSKKASGFVEMSTEELRRRMQQQQHTVAKEKTFEEVHQERVDQLQAQRDKLHAQRCSLPIYAMRQQLLDLIFENQVVILVGETGSGKTTQLLQYLYEEGLHIPARRQQLLKKVNATPKDAVRTTGEKDEGEGEGETTELKLLCTQPRRIAAIGVATRVAVEMHSRCGTLVGYKVRFDDKTSPQHTRLVFLTDGLMLKEFASDPNLQRVAAIMIDEAHERSLSTDILLGLLKDVRSRNPLVRIIIASATINAAKFADFFGGAPVVEVKGRTFPVDVYYSEAAVTDYVKESAETVMGLHLSKPLPGDILVFLPGQEAIERCAAYIRELAAEAELAGHVRPMLVLPLYSALPPKEQSRIYDVTAADTRKVVLSTNIAETSITIDGIVHVVDCGLCKQDYFNPRAMMEELVVVPASQASCNQRSGRAGRTQAGECYRLYTSYAFKNDMPPETVPEIMRCSLSAVVLQLKSLGIDDLLRFEFIDAPSTDGLARALDHLFLLGAIRRDGSLSVTGRRMAEFPLEPSLSKSLIKGCQLGVGREVAMAASILTLESVFINTSSGGGGASASAGGDPAKRVNEGKHFFFSQGNGDLCGYVSIMHHFLRSGDDSSSSSESVSSFCHRYGLNLKSLLRARDVLDQLLKIIDRVGLDLINDKHKHNNSDDTQQQHNEDLIASQFGVVNQELLTRSFLSGFFFNVSKLQEDKHTYRTIRPLELSAPSHSSGGVNSEGTLLLSQLSELPIAEIHPSSYLFRAGSGNSNNNNNNNNRYHNNNNNSVSLFESSTGGKNAEENIPVILREKPQLVFFLQLRRTKKRYMVHVTSLSKPSDNNNNNANNNNKNVNNNYTDWVMSSAPALYFTEEDFNFGLKRKR